MVEKINSNEKTFFDSIGDSLKDLMEKIKSGLNSALEWLGLKKKEELKAIDKLTENDLDALYKKIEKDFKLSENEEKEINKVKEFKEYYKWLTDSFGKDFAKKEMASFIEIELLKRIEYKKLTKDEQNEIKGKIENQKKKLTGDNKLKETTQKTLEELEKKEGKDNQYTIDQIIEAYEELKHNDQIPKPEAIINKLSGNEESNSEDSSE